MSLRNKRRELHGVVGALGVVAALGGFVANYNSPGATIVLIFAIIAVGATLVNVFIDPPGKG